MPEIREPKLESGYVYEMSTPDETGKRWPIVSDIHWITEMYVVNGNEKFVGVRRINDCRFNVFRCDDGFYRAILRWD